MSVNLCAGIRYQEHWEITISINQSQWKSLSHTNIDCIFPCVYPPYIIIYMTKCQKVRKSWVKILTVNKIWSNYVVLVLHLESVQKWPKKQWTQYKHLWWSAYGDICIRRRFKLWNRAHENGQRNSYWLLRRLRTCAQYTNKFNFTKDYKRSIPLHNSVNINRQIFNLCSWSFLKDHDDQCWT